MRIDGAQIAKDAMHKIGSKKFDKEGSVVEQEVMDRGKGIANMMSLIEAIHAKDADAAHSHFSKMISGMSADSEVTEGAEK
jgi:hypothetical protein